MIQRHYDPTKSYCYALYGRMSDPKQNPRSPDAQFSECQRTIDQLRYPWQHVKSYRDDGIKGRYMRRRPGFLAMMRDIETEILQVDLIVVDTWERFGRKSEFQQIRETLENNYGVLVVTCDTRFMNPTGPAGRVVASFEQVRSVAETEVKSHNVTRGKRDCVLRKQWPGGSPPFGMTLRHETVQGLGSNVRLQSFLIPSPETGWIMQKLFQKSFETGWAGTRLSQYLNDDPTIPDKYKPFYQATVDMWLENEIYVGTMVWGETNTDIFNDSRVVVPAVLPESILRVEEFCEPLIRQDVFAEIQRVRQARKRRNKERKAERHNTPVLGLSVKHPLAGLVRCHHCNCVAVPSTSGRKSKTGRTYSYYECPRSRSNACQNKRSFRIDDLWSAVVGSLQRRGLPPPEKSGEIPEWFKETCAIVETKLNKSEEMEPNRSKEMLEKLAQIDRNMTGWTMSLGDPSLPHATRQLIQQQIGDAVQAKSILEADMSSMKAKAVLLRKTLDPSAVLERLHRLDEMLIGTNMCTLNLELQNLIDHVELFSDGKVILHGTYLGLFEGAVEMLSEDPSGSTSSETSTDGASKFERAVPRRLARRRTSLLTGADGIDEDEVVRNLDPARFAGLSRDFIWQEHFVCTRRVSWAEENATKVEEFRLEHPEMSLNRMAKHFGKARPTISAALRVAEKLRAEKNDAA